MLPLRGKVRRLPSASVSEMLKSSTLIRLPRITSPDGSVTITVCGGAVGNAIDSLVHQGVADFVLFHITTETFNFTWYVFNLADAAIVAGVIGLLYESLAGGGVPQKRPDPTG